MPYVNCDSCGVRSFALAPWSTVDRCPRCEAPLAVPRQSVAGDRRQSRNRTGTASVDAQRGNPEETPGPG